MVTSQAKRSFADLPVRSKRRTGGCPRCSNPAPNVASLTVAVQGLGRGGSISGKRLATKGKSLCESCSVELYERFVAVVAEECENNHNKRDTAA